LPAVRLGWQLTALCALHHLLLEREVTFAKPRRWRFDFVIRSLRLAIEVEGGSWVGGGHVSGSGYARNCDKYNSAVLLGWRLLRFTTEQIRGDDAISTIARAFDIFLDELPLVDIPATALPSATPVAFVPPAPRRRRRVAS
jgi:very-short-patch-repair endonuclease